MPVNVLKIFELKNLLALAVYILKLRFAFRASYIKIFLIYYRNGDEAI